MKRFFEKATAQPLEGGHGVTLDGRQVRTPAKTPLVVPTAALADAIAAEWNAQGMKIDPRTMPLTGLANAAIDRIAPAPARFAQSIAVFAETDLLAYRADQPADLVARQNALWNPIVDWAQTRFDVAFLVTTAIIHQPQPEATLQRLQSAVAALTPFELVGMHELVTISGSLLIALALFEQAIDLDAAWIAGHLDELWQAEQWGEDALAVQGRAARRQDFETAARFLALLD